MPRHRFELALEPDALDREIARELTTVRRAVEEIHRNLRREADTFDALIDRDLVWPPETFVERRELARAATRLPFDRDGAGHDPLAELPERSAFRLIVDAPARLGSGLDPSLLPPFAVGRLYAAWLRGAVKLEGGYAWLQRALIEKIETHGGEVRRSERVERVIVRRGTAVGVSLATTGEEIGASFVLAGRSIASVLRLLPDRAAFDPLFERMGEPTPRYFRYTLHLVLREEGVPEGIARDVFFIRDPSRPRLAENLLRVEVDDGSSHGSLSDAPAAPEGTRRLTISALLPRRPVEEVTGYVSSLRERILAALGELIPFIGEHLVLVDSPHDGRDAQEIATGRLLSPEEPWERGPRTMPVVHGYPVRSTFGICAMPVRTPIKRLLLCNGQVVPGLGLEGSLLTAWSAARVVTRSDRRKEWMRRGLWTKLEI